MNDMLTGKTFGTLYVEGPWTRNSAKYRGGAYRCHCTQCGMGAIVSGQSLVLGTASCQSSFHGRAEREAMLRS